MTSFDGRLKSRRWTWRRQGAAKAKRLTDIAKLNIANSAEERMPSIKPYIDLGKAVLCGQDIAPEETLCVPV